MKENGISDLFTQSIPDIMDKWETRAKNEIISHREMSSLALRDSIPSFLDSISVLLETKKRDKEEIELNTSKLISIAKHHGRERSIKFAYMMSQVILEYHILRQVIFDVLDEKTFVSSVERDVIISAIEDATNTSATEFALALSESQDKFLFRLTHDLRTPITAVNALAELITRSNDVPVSRRLAVRIVGQVNSMDEMITDILDTGRVEAGRELSFVREKCDIYEIALDVIKEMESVYGDWFILLDDGPVLGMWNRQYLRRIIENLVNNAFKFRSPGTKVTITLEKSEYSAILSVHNLGNPITNESQSDLFRPFHRIKNTDQKLGWGLGLAFVKGVVDSFGGSISVESSIEKGTCFIVTLPKGELN
jgi:signal transduction histidine kinase